MGYISTFVEVDVRDLLDHLDDNDLLEEANRRDLAISDFTSSDTIRDLLTQVWHKRRLNQNFDYELDKLIYYSLGKVI